jgi:MFS transporter, ACS family, glucarate transporter
MSSQAASQSSARLPDGGSVRPTRVRFRVVGMLTLITALTYLDRLNLGIAGHYIELEFALDTQTMGWILSGFVAGYALFQVPGGWAGDRFGPRSVLTFAIVWWSIFTAATALAPVLPFRAWFGLAASFIIVRFLIGVGEAATLPNSNKIVAFWMGEGGRGVGNSMFLMGLGLGGAVTPMFIAWIMEHAGWRASFYACAVLGVVAATCWHLMATSRPEQHPGVNAAELALIRGARTQSDSEQSSGPPRGAPVPWKRLLSSVSSWSLILSYFCEGYPNYIFYTWFFLYLIQVRHLSIQQGGFWGGAPFLAVVFLAPLGGWFSDWAVVRFGKRRGRQAAVWLGMCLSGVLLSAGAHTANNTAAIILLAAAMGFNIFSTSTWWATCIDLSPNFSGSLSATMNTSGNIGGWVSPILTAYIATHFGWTQALDFAAVLTFVAAILWLGVNAEDNLEIAP